MHYISTILTWQDRAVLESLKEKKAANRQGAAIRITNTCNSTVLPIHSTKVPIFTFVTFGLS